MPHSRPTHFKAFLIAGTVLTALAGYTNVVTLLETGGLSSSHMTGTISRVAIELMGGPGLPLAMVASTIVAFIGGAAIAGAALTTTKVQLGERYGVLLLIEGLLLAGAALLMRRDPFLGTMVAAAGCGLQNGMGTHLSQAIVRTTHVTGLVTDLGLALGKFIGRRGVDGWRVTLYLALFTGFFGGSLLGGIGHAKLGDDALWPPAAAAMLLGGFYVIALRSGRLAPQPTDVAT